MDAVLEILAGRLAVTTLGVTTASSVIFLLLPTLGITSPKTHRIAWGLVLLQGWLLLPLTLTVSVPPSEKPNRISRATPTLREPARTPQAQPINPSRGDSPDWWRLGRRGVGAAWLLGTLTVSGFYLRRLALLTKQMPLGSVPESEAWNQEWREAVGAVGAKANPHFRVTERTGPLLCFVPFAYLVLVPRELWAGLSRDERMAILRHELAHLKRGDLGKNLAVRLLALPQWFNPLAWLAVRRFEEAGEWACDQAALATPGLSHVGYADALVRVVGFSNDAPCGAAPASGGALSRRIQKLLSPPSKESSRMKNSLPVLLLLVIAATQAIRVESVQAESPVAPDPLAARAEAVAQYWSSPYLIEPPDVLEIQIKCQDFFQADRKSDPAWKITAQEVNLCVESLVEPDGFLTLKIPGAERVNVSGKTLAQAKELIATALPAPFNSAEVIVNVNQQNSKNVYVIGESEAGEYAIRIGCVGPGHLTLLDALANLHTNREFHNKNHRVHVVPAGKQTEDGADRLTVDLEVLRSPGNAAMNVELIPGDRVLVEKISSAD